MIERPNHVRVVNTGKLKIVGRFDGEDYEFIPNKPADIPIVVARHIFGFGEENKAPALNRLGWLQTSDSMEKAMAELNKIVFTEAPPLVEADVPDPEDDPAADRVPLSGSTAPPMSPEASGGGGAGRHLPAPPKPRG
jgi:hypothetical protein